MVYLTRIEHFNAAHKLYNPGWSREKNEEVFGKCANENWHGHNFDMIVTVAGEPDAETGFVIDLKQLSTLIRKEIVEKVEYAIEQHPSFLKVIPQEELEEQERLNAKRTWEC